MILRRWHRWIALPSALFILFIAVTGVLLHLDMIRLGHAPPGSEPPPKVASAPMPSDAELAAMMSRITAAARREDGLVVKMVQIDLSGPRITATAGPGGPPGSPQIKIDARTGTRIIDPPPPADFHYILQNLHAGYQFDWLGRIMSIVCGLTLAALSVTGLQVLWSMKRHRGKGWFWK